MGSVAWYNCDMGLTFTAQKKNRDHMLLLVSDSDFRRDAQEMRRNLGMPPGGFKTDTNHDAWLVKAANQCAKLADPEDRNLSAFMRFVRAPRILAERYSLPGNY